MTDVNRKETFKDDDKHITSEEMKAFKINDDEDVGIEVRPVDDDNDGQMTPDATDDATATTSLSSLSSLSSALDKLAIVGGPAISSSAPGVRFSCESGYNSGGTATPAERDTEVASASAAKRQTLANELALALQAAQLRRDEDIGVEVAPVEDHDHAEDREDLQTVTEEKRVPLLTCCSDHRFSVIGERRVLFII